MEIEVVAIQQMSELDSYSGHPTPFNQVCDGVQNSIVTSIEDRES